MNVSGCARTVILVWFGLVQSAWVYVYASGAHASTAIIGDVPSESRYVILIPTQPDAALRSIIKPPPEFANKEQYEYVVAEVARTYGLDSALLHAVISVESRYIPNAVSKKGAAGLMQLTPQTAKRYGVANPFDPVQNLNGGAKCLRDLMKVFNNDISLTLAAYNAGKSAVVRHGNSIPPFRETKNYVPRVLAFYRKYRSEPI